MHGSAGAIFGGTDDDAQLRRGIGAGGNDLRAGEVSTENGGTTARGMDHASPLVSCIGVRAKLRITPSSPLTLYTTRAATGGGGNASVRYSWIVDVIDGVGLGIVAMEVRLGQLRIRRRGDPEGQRATVAGSKPLGYAVHEQLGLPALRDIERELLQVYRQRAAVMQLRHQQERFACRDDRCQHIALAGRERLGHGPAVRGSGPDSEIEA